jgi:transposase-like protein
MRQKQEAKSGSAEKTVRDIRRATRRRHSSEEKIRIVLEGLRGEDSIAELCRREELNQNVYCRLKEFLESAKSGLPAIRPARPPSDEVKDIRAELRQLKEDASGEPTAQKKRDRGWGDDE